MSVERRETHAAVLARALELFRAHPASEPVPAPQAPEPLPGRLGQDYVRLDGGHLRLHRGPEAPGRPVLVLHDAAGSIRTVERLTRSFLGRRPVLALELPGNGESDDVVGPGEVSVARYAEVVEQALGALGLDEVDVLGLRGSGLVGLELSLRRPGLVRHLGLTGVPYHSEGETRELAANPFPSIAPVWYGGHLLLAWHLIRDQSLFWPWFRRTRAGIIRREPYVDTDVVHGRVVALLQCGDRYREAYESHFAYPTLEKLRQSRVPTLLAAPDWDPKLPHTEAAARAAPACTFRVLPRASGEWGPVFLDFVEAADR